MKDVELVLRVNLQAAAVLGAELGQGYSERPFIVDAAEIDLVLGSSGLGLRGRSQGGGWWLELGVVGAGAPGQGWGLNRVLGPRLGVGIRAVLPILTLRPS